MRMRNGFERALVQHQPAGLTRLEIDPAAQRVIAGLVQGNLVRPGVNGYVIPAGDVSALAQSLQTVLGSEETSRAMGAESLRIIQDYSFDQNISGIRQALHALSPGFPLASTSQPQAQDSQHES